MAEFIDPVKQYALDVTSGKELAGPMVRMACQRHILDLEEGPKRGLKWVWPSAERVIGYFRDVLRLAGGAYEGMPFVLAPPQQFIVGSIYGWLKQDDTRRFGTAYVEMGKGQGKSPLGGGIGLYMCSADGEMRAECYAAAVDKDQAKIPFRDAVAMVDQSPALLRRFTKTPKDNPDVTKVWNLAHLDSGSFFRPMATESMGRGKSGFRPYYVLLDEVHEHATDAMVEFMRKNIKGRPNALVLMITNSGVYDINSVCFRYHAYAERILTASVEGDPADDEFFAFVCGLDVGDSWTDPRVWKKSCPMLGITIQQSYLEKEVREAEGMPSKQSLTRRLNFCEWVEAENPLVTKEVWDANAGSVDLELLKGRTCFGGLDLSGKNDLTALVLVFPLDDGTKAVLPFFWTPKDGLRQRGERDRAPYQSWAQRGFLSVTPGKSIDFSFVAAEIGKLAALYHIDSIACDPYKLDYMDRALQAEGIGEIALHKHNQGFITMNLAIEVLEDDLLEGRIRHGNHPVLNSCVHNSQVDMDAAGNRKLNKRKSTGRIDGAVALAMADNLSSIKGDVDHDYQVLFV